MDDERERYRALVGTIDGQDLHDVPVKTWSQQVLNDNTLGSEVSKVDFAYYDEAGQEVKHAFVQKSFESSGNEVLLQRFKRETDVLEALTAANVPFIPQLLEKRRSNGRDVLVTPYIPCARLDYLYPGIGVKAQALAQHIAANKEAGVSFLDETVIAELDNFNMLQREGEKIKLHPLAQQAADIWGTLVQDPETREDHYWLAYDLLEQFQHNVGECLAGKREKFDQTSTKQYASEFLQALYGLRPVERGNDAEFHGIAADLFAQVVAPRLSEITPGWNHGESFLFNIGLKSREAGDLVLFDMGDVAIRSPYIDLADFTQHAYNCGNMSDAQREEMWERRFENYPVGNPVQVREVTQFYADIRSTAAMGGALMESQRGRLHAGSVHAFKFRHGMYAGLTHGTLENMKGLDWGSDQQKVRTFCDTVQNEFLSRHLPD